MYLRAFIVSLLLGLSCSALGGPDHKTTVPYCLDLYRSLKSEHHSRAVRDVVQALQSTESYLGQLQLGRPLPSSSVVDPKPNVTTLTGWKDGNATRLLRLLEGTPVAQSLGGSAAAAAVARSCASSRLNASAFTGRPVVSVLLEYFKRPTVVNRIAAALRRNCAEVGMPCELVVHVDNPHEAGAWAAEVAAGFVVPVFSANVHESRGYNRAAKLARGRYLVIWQDDQIPPEKGQWLLDMVRVFDAHPHLGILGMNTYRLCKHTEPTNRFFFTAWQPDEKTGVKWTYAQTVDFAPLAIRASIFAALGGLDEGASRQGECGIWGDWELCARAWMDGWTVGYMFLDGRSGDGQPGGTHVGASGERCWGRQQYVASSLFHKRYGADQLQGQWCDRIWLLNMFTFKLGPSGACPYASQETKFGNCSALSPEHVAEASGQIAALSAERQDAISGAGAAPRVAPFEFEGGLPGNATGAAGDDDDGGSGVLELAPLVVREAEAAASGGGGGGAAPSRRMRRRRWLQ